MKASNYALISALYANRSRGLYSDIYFPIIKYCVAKIYSDKIESDHYASSDDVYNKILELFGIKIPHVVIAMTIKKLAYVGDANIELQVYEEGNTFRILNAWYDEDEKTCLEKEQAFNVHLREIELEYEAFIKREGAIDEDVKFVDFISANTESILGYFEDEKEAQVEEKYSSMVFFLEYLHRENNELYKVANQLFWSSVIAAFLQSERPRVNDEERGCETEYYLDTSIVMGLLDLSTVENQVSASDVCDIIKSSGGSLKVHPATLEEIKTILTSVAQNGAYPGTSIANACTRRNLDAPYIMKINVNLYKEVEKVGLQVFPASVADCRRTVLSKYRGKAVLKELADMRSYNTSDSSYSYSSSDQFREAHDIFMDDYIRDVRKAKHNKDNVYFLTTNTDLIEFCKERHKGDNYMISTGKVILEMWMHNAKPAEVSATALTETMARCLDLHRSKVRNKLHEVARYFNRNKEDVAPEVYNEFLRLLYRRARKVVTAVNVIPEDDPKAFMQTLQDAIKEDNAYYETVNSEMNTKNENLSKEVSQKEEQVQNLSYESEQKSQQIGSLKDRNENLNAEKSALETNLKIAETALNAAKEETAKEQQDKNAAQRLNQLYAHRDELDEKLIGLKATLEPLEANRSKSFSYTLPKWLLIGGIAIIVATVVLLVLDKAGIFTLMTWEASAVVVAIGGILIGAALTLGAEDRVKKLRDNAYAQWDEEHPSYPKLIVQISEIEEELRFTKREIKNSTSQK